MPSFVRSLLATVCLLFAGCATLSRPPSDVAVTLADVRPVEATAFESRLAVTVRFTNQSPEQLSLSGSRHTLTLNGRAIGTAVSSESLILPALSSTTQDVTLNLSNFALLSLVRDLQRNPAATYEIESTLFGSGAFSRRTATSQKGVIDLRTLAGTPAP